jgi:hypothetical protein
VDWLILEMFKNLALALVYSVLINWCVSMQILNQVSKNKSVKVVSTIMSVLLGFVSGFLLLVN